MMAEWIFLLPGLTLTAGLANEDQRTPLIPYVDGEWWQVAHNPSSEETALNGGQVVDHCFLRGVDRKWRLWTQIRGTREGRLFYLWEGTEDIERAQWKARGICWKADTTVGESQGTGREVIIQAPYVMQEEKRYVLLYGGGPVEKGGERQICAATSTDGVAFRRSQDEKGRSRLFVGPGMARDPMVLEIGGEYVVYYCADEGGKGVIAARTSSSLLGSAWSEYVVVSEGGMLGTNSWSQQCPFVVFRDGYYYLFKMAGSDAYKTVVCRSEDPLDFGKGDEKVVAILETSASEIIVVGDRYYISSLIPGYMGVRLTRLKWRYPLT